MIEIAALKEMSEKVIADYQDLLKMFEAELHKLSQVSFDQVKEIEQAINSLQKKGRSG